MPIYETGDYTMPDGFESRPSLEEESFVDSDYDEAEPTTLTRARWR